MTSGIAWIRPRVRATDSYTFNWWIPLGSPELDWFPNQWDGQQPHPPAEVTAQFLKPEDRAKGIEERKQLASTGYAPNYLCEHVLAWARRHPEDPRVPEALHYAVATTHYAASNPQSSDYSIQAQAASPSLRQEHLGQTNTDGIPQKLPLVSLHSG